MGERRGYQAGGATGRCGADWAVRGELLAVRARPCVWACAMRAAGLAGPGHVAGRRWGCIRARGLGRGTASGRAEQAGRAGGCSWLGGFRPGLVSRLG